LRHLRTLPCGLNLIRLGFRRCGRDNLLHRVELGSAGGMSLLGGSVESPDFF
jgi:hypothetical protein